MGPLILLHVSIILATALSRVALTKLKQPKTNPNILLKSVVLPYLTKFLPTVRAPAKVKYQYLTTDPDRLDQMKKKPRKNVSSGPMMDAMLKRGKRLVEPEYVSQSIDRPTLILHGTGDLVNLHSGSEEYFNLLTSVTDKKMYSYKNYFHDMFQETPERIEKVLKDLKAWLDKHSEIADHPNAILTSAPKYQIMTAVPNGFF